MRVDQEVRSQEGLDTIAALRLMLLDGAATPRGGSARNQPFPERSTGYCVNCHIGLTKIDGVWAATPAGLPQ